MKLAFEQPFGPTKSSNNNPTGRLIGGGEDPADFFEIRSVDSPRSIPPGETFIAEVEWGASQDGVDRVDTDHPNYCNAGGILPAAGADMFSRIRLGSASDSGIGNCWTIENPDSIHSQRQIAAPTEPGDYTLTAEIVGAGNMITYDTWEVDITVDDDSPDPPDDSDTNGSDNGSGDDIWDITLPGGDDIGFPEIPSTGVIALVLMLVLLLVIAVLS